MHWGLVPYDEALRRQKALMREVIAGEPGALVLCEHPLTLTLGRASHEANLLWPREELARRGYALIEADRGGDVTLHAPGQLVVYPIIDLRLAQRDLGAYLDKLGQASVDFLADFGIVAESVKDRRGVWVGAAKIASIGIGVSRWVTYHGVAVNINNDLSLFRAIRPCGLDVAMTSVAQLTGQAVLVVRAAENFADHFLRVFT
jgi:lipoate-protein ligase B